MNDDIDNYPIELNKHLPTSSSAPITNLPLGTASWFEFPKGCNPVFNPKAGDLFLGRTLTGHPVGVRDDRHVMVCAGTRAEKGVSIIVPNLLFWLGSCVVVDPKGENAKITARRRGRGSKHTKGMGQKVYLLDPVREAQRPNDTFDDLRASFNPLDLIGVNIPESIDNAARIADSLIDTDASQSDPFWVESARDLMKAVCLHVASSDHFETRERNLITVRKLILEGSTDLRDLMMDDDPESNSPSAFEVLFRAMSRNRAFSGEVAIAGERYGRMAIGGAKMLESIAAVAASNMDFLASDEMRACVSHSSFSLDELKTSNSGVSIFVCLPQRFMNTHHRFVRMIVTLILTQMEKCSQQPASGLPVLMLLDEFAGLKKLPIIETSSAQIAGYGVKLMFIVQSLAQLRTVYRDNWETLVANCGIKMFFGNDDHFTRDHVSKLIGECEVVRQTASLSETQGSSHTHSIGGSIARADSASTSDTYGVSYGGSGVQFSVSHAASQSKSLTLSVNENRSNGANQSKTHGTSQSVHKRMLLSPDEVGRIFGNREARRALVILSGLQPLQLERIRYYNEVAIAGLFDPHPDHPKPPTRAQLQKRDGENQRQAVQQRQRVQEQRQAAQRKRNEEIKRANERYFRERARERQQKHRQAYVQYKERQDAYDREFLPPIIGCVALLVLWVGAVLVT